MLSGQSTLILLLFTLSMQVKDNFQTIAADVAKSIKEDKDLKGMLEALQASVMFSLYY